MILGSPQYIWEYTAGTIPNNGTNSNTLSTSIPGEYTIEITGTYQGNSYYGYRRFWIGFEGAWIEKVDTHTDPTFPGSIYHTSTLPSAAFASTANEALSGMNFEWAIRRITNDPQGYPILPNAPNFLIYFDRFSIQNLLTGNVLASVDVISLDKYIVVYTPQNGISQVLFPADPGDRIIIRVIANVVIVDNLMTIWDHRT